MKTWVKRITVAECRAMGQHNMVRTRAFGYDAGEVFAMWYCSRCGTRKSRWYSFITGIFTSNPVYYRPKDYPYFKRGSKPSAASLRADFFHALRKRGKMISIPNNQKIEHRAYKARKARRKKAA